MLQSEGNKADGFFFSLFSFCCLGLLTVVIPLRALQHYIFDNCYVAIKHRLPHIDFCGNAGEAIDGCKFWEMCIPTTALAQPALTAWRRVWWQLKGPQWPWRLCDEVDEPPANCRARRWKWGLAQSCEKWAPGIAEWCDWAGNMPAAVDAYTNTVSLIINPFSTRFTHLLPLSLS